MRWVLAICYLIFVLLVFLLVGNMKRNCCDTRIQTTLSRNGGSVPAHTIPSNPDAQDNPLDTTLQSQSPDSSPSDSSSTSGGTQSARLPQGDKPDQWNPETKSPLSTIEFEYNSTLMRDKEASQNILQDILHNLNSHQTILLMGHTDNTGDATSNLLLGLWRAESIRDELVLLGANPRQIEVASSGQFRPSLPNNSLDGRSRNRRVEIYISN